MIYLNMGGGRLGNQLFRYAFARELQKHNPKERIVYNFDEIHRTIYNSGFANDNYLNFFNIKGLECQDAINYSIPQYIILKIFNRFYPRETDFIRKQRYETKWVKVLELFGLYYFNYGFHKFNLKKPWWVKNIILNGAFESEKYFPDIKAQLKEEITPKYSIQEYNKELVDIIRNTNSVAISIRRGDFVDDNRIRGTYYVCDKKYYEEAIANIRERVKEPTFIFFSNDIEWVKNNIQIDGCPCYYESGKDEVWETLRLMSSCKHFIISNSTLHWWAQYLSDNDDKIVIAPSRWFNLDMHSEIYQNHWILLPVSIDRK